MTDRIEQCALLLDVLELRIRQLARPTAIIGGQYAAWHWRPFMVRR